VEGEVTDVAVHGATGAGVMAAVAAARAGATTVLVEPGRHVGGMVSGGLSWTDVGDERVVGGLVLEPYQRVAEHYGVPLWGVKGPEPHVAERLLNELLDDAGVDLRLGERDLPDAAVTVDASHEIERAWRYLPEYERTPAVFDEGYLSVAVPPDAIPYRCLTPPRERCEDLLMPVCLSASHVAFASVRMEPTLMALGHAAGEAAAQAARRGVAVQDVDVDALQRALAGAGQVLAA
jgi:hypothetical protein